MNVGDLIDILENYSRETLVIISKDREGNDYSPLDAVDEANYEPDNSWSGTCAFSSPEPNALVLWPVN